MIVVFNGPQDIGDDALVIRPGAVNAVDKEDRRSRAANLGQEVSNHAVFKTERRGESQPAPSFETIRFQEKNRPASGIYTCDVLQHRRLPAAGKTAEVDEPALGETIPDPL